MSARPRDSWRSLPLTTSRGAAPCSRAPCGPRCAIRSNRSSTPAASPARRPTQEAVIFLSTPSSPRVGPTPRRTSPRTRCSPPPGRAPRRSGWSRSAPAAGGPAVPRLGARRARRRRDRHRHRRLRALAAARHARRRRADHRRHRGRAPAPGQAGLRRGRASPSSARGTISGAALDVLPRLTDGHYDLVFCDGDKAEYGAYLKEALRLLRPGGVVAFDNALWHDRVADPSQRDEETVAIRELGRERRRERGPGLGAAAGRRRPAGRQEAVVAGGRRVASDPAGAASKPVPALGDGDDVARLDQHRRAADRAASPATRLPPR